MVEISDSVVDELIERYRLHMVEYLRYTFDMTETRAAEVVEKSVTYQLLKDKELKYWCESKECMLDMLLDEILTT